MGFPPTPATPGARGLTVLAAPALMEAEIMRKRTIDSVATRRAAGKDLRRRCPASAITGRRWPSSSMILCTRTMSFASRTKDRAIRSTPRRMPHPHVPGQALVGGGTDLGGARHVLDGDGEHVAGGQLVRAVGEAAQPDLRPLQVGQHRHRAAQLRHRAAQLRRRPAQVPVGGDGRTDRGHDLRPSQGRGFLSSLRGWGKKKGSDVEPSGSFPRVAVNGAMPGGPARAVPVRLVVRVPRRCLWCAGPVSGCGRCAGRSGAAGPRRAQDPWRCRPRSWR